MAEHIEIETKELQEKIKELDEEREKLHEEEAQINWVRYVGLTTAILAVLAAVGALQSGSLVNEAMINQIKASDAWNEYQASRQKDHLYTITLDRLVDENASNRAVAAAMQKPMPESSGESPARSDEPVFVAMSAPERATEYRTKIAQEAAKEKDRSAEARKLEAEAAEQIQKQRSFEYSVALIQVAIALGAVSALTRVKPVWYLSLLSGASGVALFAIGFFR
jgi:hypothetical protein